MGDTKQDPTSYSRLTEQSVETPTYGSADDLESASSEESPLSRLSEHTIRRQETLAYAIMVLLGAGLLLPWNTVVNASSYFKDVYDFDFPFYSPMAYLYPSIPLLFLMIRYGDRFSFSIRIIVCFVVQSFILVVCPIAAGASSSSLSLTVVIGALVIGGCATAVLQASLFGFASVLPGKQTQAIMAGNGWAGLFSSAMRMVTKGAMSGNEQGSAHIFFFLSAAVMLLCVAGYVVVVRLDFTRAHLRNTRSGAAPSHAATAPAPDDAPGADKRVPLLADDSGAKYSEHDAGARGGRAWASIAVAGAPPASAGSDGATGADPLHPSASMASMATQQSGTTPGAAGDGGAAVTGGAAGTPGGEDEEVEDVYVPANGGAQSEPGTSPLRAAVEAEAGGSGGVGVAGRRGVAPPAQLATHATVGSALVGEEGDGSDEEGAGAGAGHGRGRVSRRRAASRPEREAPLRHAVTTDHGRHHHPHHHHHHHHHHHPRARSTGRSRVGAGGDALAERTATRRLHRKLHTDALMSPNLLSLRRFMEHTLEAHEAAEHVDGDAGAGAGAAGEGEGDGERKRGTSSAPSTPQPQRRRGSGPGDAGAGAGDGAGDGAARATAMRRALVLEAATARARAAVAGQQRAQAQPKREQEWDADVEGTPSRYAEGDSESESDKSEVMSAGSGAAPTADPLVIIRKIWPLAVQVCLVFTMTFVVFPGEVYSFHYRSSYGFLDVFEGHDWWPIFMVFLFNLFDLTGRTLPQKYVWLTERSLWTAVLLRFLLIPFFVMAVHPIDGLQMGDWMPIVLMAIFAVTNGYCASLGMMFAPGKVEPHEREVTGFIMGFCLQFGIFLGSQISLLIKGA